MNKYVTTGSEEAGNLTAAARDKGGKEESSSCVELKSTSGFRTPISADFCIALFFVLIVTAIVVVVTK